MDTGLLASVVSSTLLRPTIDFVIPPTVPVNVGPARSAYPEIDAPDGIVTVPVKVGDAIGAFAPSAVVIVDA